MSIEEAKTISFKSESFNKWKEIAEKTLRGKSIDSVSKQTYEGIKLSPLYTREHLDSIEVEQFPGIGSTIRGRLKADTNTWKIAQVLEKRNWEDLKSDIVTGIKNGLETISFDADILLDIHRLNFMELRKVADFNVYPLFIISKTNFHEVALKLLQSDGINISGVMGKDLLSSDLHNGFLFKPTSNLFNNWLETVEKLNKHCDHLRTIVIDVTSYQSSGASAIQELGIAISEAVFYIEKMQEYGWDPIKTIQKIVFQFSIGGQFFIEIAKLRAFKKLWKMIADAYDIPHDQNHVLISAKTSRFTKTRLDPYVNMLRSGNEAFAAVIGGIDFLHVTPLNDVEGEPNTLSNRIARNTQLLLREEAHLNKVIDQGGGSYYIESLTWELVEQAWGFFQEMDRQGGIYDVLESGWLQQVLQRTMEQRRIDLDTRVTKVIGVNIFAKLDEQVFYLDQKEQVSDAQTQDLIMVPPIVPERLAEGFELLRKRSTALIKRGNIPVAGLICLGVLKDYKQQADFISSVLAAGGIDADRSSSCESIDDIKTFMMMDPRKYYCICGMKEQYNEPIIETIKQLREINHLSVIDIAGKYDKHDLALFGVQGSIYSGQNISKKLDSLLTIWEVAQDAE